MHNSSMHSRVSSLPHESSEEHDQITGLLQAWGLGDDRAGDALLSQIYDELHRLASGLSCGERDGHTLSATALVNEAYLRIAKQRHLNWQCRAQLFALAGRMVRRILVDHARRRGAAKRGAGLHDQTLEEVADLRLEAPEEMLALDAALQRLQVLDPTRAQVVEHRFFAGLSTVETAEVLGCSQATVKRHWRMAKAWLYRELTRVGRQHHVA